MLAASIGSMFFLLPACSIFQPKEYAILVTEDGTLEDVFKKDERVRLDEYPLDGVNCPYILALEDFEVPIRGRRGFEIWINDDPPFRDLPFSKMRVEAGDIVKIRVKTCE